MEEKQKCNKCLINAKIYALLRCPEKRSLRLKEHMRGCGKRASGSDEASKAGVKGALLTPKILTLYAGLHRQRYYTFKKTTHKCPNRALFAV